MKRLTALFFVVFATSALAAEWTRYENSRFGYVVDVPPGFAGEGEAQNGDGQIFRSAEGTQLLRVYGGHIMEENFEASVQTAMGYAAEAGWSLSYERVTPSWASYSGTRNGQILYARAIPLCDGTQYATFEYEYPEAEINATHDLVERLVASLKATGGGVSC